MFGQFKFVQQGVIYLLQLISREAGVCACLNGGAITVYGHRSCLLSYTCYRLSWPAPMRAFLIIEHSFFGQGPGSVWSTSTFDAQTPAFMNTQGLHH